MCSTALDSINPCDTAPINTSAIAQKEEGDDRQMDIDDLVRALRGRPTRLNAPAFVPVSGPPAFTPAHFPAGNANIDEWDHVPRVHYRLETEIPSSPGFPMFDDSGDFDEDDEELEDYDIISFFDL